MIKLLYSSIFPPHVRNSIRSTLGYRTYNPIKKINGKNVIFVHIPKTGGTSIGPKLGFKKSVHYRFGANGDKKSKEETDSELGTLQHRDTKELIEIIGSKKWNKAFKFSFVRNPWARLYSYYNYKIKINHHQMSSHPIEFNDWINAICGGDRNPKYYHVPKLFQSQYDWLTDYDGKLAMDFIGRQEDFQNDFEKVAKLLKIDKNIGHTNKSKKGDYRKAYSEQSIELVRKVYQKDIELWNYEF